jgi:hypothetical protein
MRRLAPRNDAASADALVRSWQSSIRRSVFCGVELALRILVMMQPVSDPDRAPDFLSLVCNQLHNDAPAGATSSATSNPHSVSPPWCAINCTTMRRLRPRPPLPPRTRTPFLVMMQPASDPGRAPGLPLPGVQSIAQRCAGYGYVLLFHLEPALRILVMIQPVPMLWSDPGRARYDPRFCGVELATS